MGQSMYQSFGFSCWEAFGRPQRDRRHYRDAVGKSTAPSRTLKECSGTHGKEATGLTRRDPSWDREWFCCPRREVLDISVRVGRDGNKESRFDHSQVSRHGDLAHCCGGVARLSRRSGYNQYFRRTGMPRTPSRHGVQRRVRVRVVKVWDTRGDKAKRAKQGDVCDAAGARNVASCSTRVEYMFFWRPLEEAVGDRNGSQGKGASWEGELTGITKRNAVVVCPRTTSAAGPGAYNPCRNRPRMAFCSCQPACHCYRYMLPSCAVGPL
ncbi:hypothetical protein BJ546DRAFT_327144 [Cryomyces antarcticus]